MHCNFAFNLNSARKRNLAIRADVVHVAAAAPATKRLAAKSTDNPTRAKAIAAKTIVKAGSARASIELS
jgi:hypothetical protein